MNTPEPVTPRKSTQHKLATTIAHAFREFETKRRLTFETVLDENTINFNHVHDTWIDLWTECDFTWKGLRDAGWNQESRETTQAQLIKRWSAPFDFPGSGESHGNKELGWKESNLQEYWRWSLGITDDPWPGRLLSDDELLALGFLHEVNGELFHWIHIADSDLINGLTSTDTTTRHLPSENIRPANSRLFRLLAYRAQHSQIADVSRQPRNALRIDGIRSTSASTLFSEVAKDLEDSALDVSAALGDLGCFQVPGYKFGNKTSFVYAFFREGTDFSGCSFGSRAKFTGATFEPWANFDGTNFAQSLRLDKALFGKQATFTKTTYGDDAWLMGSMFGDVANFAQSEFGNAAKFISARFGKWAVFGSCRFNQNVSFAKCAFRDHASFQDSLFGNGSSFNQTVFDDNADFANAAFAESASFVETRFSNAPNFSRANFGSNAQFADAVFGEHANFSGCEFQTNATFLRASFGANAYFIDSRIGPSAQFSAAKFEVNCNFQNSKFSGDVQFHKSEFEDGAHFDNVEFEGDADFQSSQFKDFAWFGSANFNKQANFDECAFGIKAQFPDANFGSSASFASASFGHSPWFGGVRFRGALSFDSTVFGDEAVFHDAQFENSISFFNARFLGCSIFLNAAWNEEIFYGSAFSGSRFDDLADFRTKNFASFAAFRDATFKDRLLLQPTSEGIRPEDVFSRELRTATQAIKHEKDFVVPRPNEARKDYQKRLKLAHLETQDRIWSDLAGGYRVAKKAMEAIGDFDREQTYYRFEIKARMRRPRISAPERVASSFYRVFSDYGASIGRPFVGLALFTFAFAATYWLLATISLPPSADSENQLLVSNSAETPLQALEFSLNNAFRPLSALATQEPVEGTMVDVREKRLGERLLFDATTAWGLVVRLLAIMQSLLSFVLAFLFGLAVRRKFQID